MAIHGSGKEYGELKPVKCTYKDCQQRFDNEKDMKRHKKHDPNHNYCRRCDLDFNSWEELTQHKVTVMDRWQRAPRDEREDGPAHVTCEFCGLDFHTFGGRKTHRAQTHKAAQSLKCPGCEALFTKAGNMIAHLEEGHCKTITAYEFRASIVRKRITPEIMNNADEVRRRMGLTVAHGNDDQAPSFVGNITDGSEALDEEEGGVPMEPLLDQNDPEQQRGFPAMQPEVDLLSRDAPLTMGDPLSRAKREKWPRLPGISTPMDPAMLMRKLSVASTAASAIGSATTDVPSDITSRQEAALMNTSNSTNLLHTHFYDPSSPDCDVERFFHPLTQTYVCPFPGCDDLNGNEVRYETPSEIKAHVYRAHLEVRHACPTCKRRYDTATAFVRHIEDTNKCRVKDSKDFYRLLDTMTGGFIKAKLLDEPFLYSTSSAVIKADAVPLDGAMKVKFTAKLPDEV
ncbi:hypothetical protein BAUCODRAFT_67325 [Baudoinia panamericana UAMH 10762]|uniref:C2H2-type domain-containing protein n=1 Tax=Baudoinia panamericana (strain UAMH 10762) TaxID=717646 RepID=M2NG51_BAUPA|nr:uncharacterized protein BAUCODRAFT_67325 [Baudoinia panamericana UAMH 10762]EMC97965.1 hypothetical protein BAUCODRAFT_67325 [Baudoinia panamericana UAMH 10762]